MNAVSNIGSSSATFSAEIFSSGPEPIADHGFAWGKTRPFINSQSLQVKSLGSKSGKGGFNTTIEFPFERATIYYVRPYVVTETTIVYGNMLQFKGKF